MIIVFCFTMLVDLQNLTALDNNQTCVYAPLNPTNG